MKSIQSLLFVGTLPILLLVTGAASAQKDKDTKPVDTKHAPAATSTDAKKGPCAVLSSDLIGAKVMSTQGEKIGKIEDVVVSPNGDVGYAVLSFGGVMGLGDKYFAIPWNVLDSEKLSMKNKEKSDDRALVLPLDKERLKNAPGFDKSHWPTMADVEWAKDVDTYYADARRKDGSRPVEASARVTGPIWRASELKGFDVKTPSGEKLGDIKELAFDPSGHVVYSVVSVGGFLGMGDHLVAIPWGAFKTSAGSNDQKRMITLSATKEQLKAAPKFLDSADRRAEMCDPTWIKNVYEYYSVRPYWSGDAPGANG